MKSSSNSYKASKMMAHLRQFCLYYHEPRSIAKANAKVKKFLTKKDGTPSKKYLVAYRCEKCQGAFEKVDLHHHEPVGKAPGWPYDIDELLAYIKRLLVPVEGWAVLCKPCHKDITYNEDQERT